MQVLFPQDAKSPTRENAIVSFIVDYLCAKPGVTQCKYVQSSSNRITRKNREKTKDIKRESRGLRSLVTTAKKSRCTSKVVVLLF